MYVHFLPPTYLPLQFSYTRSSPRKKSRGRLAPHTPGKRVSRVRISCSEETRCCARARRTVNREREGRQRESEAQLWKRDSQTSRHRATRETNTSKGLASCGRLEREQHHRNHHRTSCLGPRVLEKSSPTGHWVIGRKGKLSWRLRR